MSNVNELLEFFTSDSIMTLEEGIARTIGGNGVDSVVRIGSDMAALISGFNSNEKRAYAILDDIKDYIKDNEITLDHHNSTLISAMNHMALWRFAIFFRDNQYRRMLSDIKEGDSVRGMWLDVKGDRSHISLDSAKTSKDLLKTVNLLETRVKEISSTLARSKAKGHNPGNISILGVVLVGAANDLKQLIHAIIRYSK